VLDGRVAMSFFLFHVLYRQGLESMCAREVPNCTWRRKRVLFYHDTTQQREKRWFPKVFLETNTTGCTTC
jgi:hypothetical protein